MDAQDQVLELEPEQLSDDDRKVRDWRYEQFRALGLSRREGRLAAESSADLALVRRLVGSGCAPALAMQIAL